MTDADERTRQYQLERNAAITQDAHVFDKLYPFLQRPRIHNCAAANADGEEPRGTTTTLLLSPYPNRRAVVLFQAVDRPCDDENGGNKQEESSTRELPWLSEGDPSSASRLTSPVVCATASPNGIVFPTPVPWQSTDAFSPAFFKRKEVETGAKGPYAALSYVRGETAVPFTALLETLRHACFHAMPPRRALLDQSWSLKWVKKPLPSDFSKVQPSKFQKLNHFPGSSILGRKDGLHRLLRAAFKYLEANVSHDTAAGLSPAQSLSLIFPKGFLLPHEREQAEHALTAPENAGKLFIVKPTTAACGRGIYLIKGGKEAATELPSRSSGDGEHKEGDGGESENGVRASFIVQEYIQNPFLAHRYKFDLRLYVVVTSYRPLRAYVYNEGLVRFATSPYITQECGGGVVAPHDHTTAHLTNFTINKRSEDYVVPRCDGEGKPKGDAAGPGADDASIMDGTAPLSSKWSFAALAMYVVQQGYSWDRTWDAIKDALSKVILSVRPHVSAALDQLDKEDKAARKRSAPPAFASSGADARERPASGSSPSLDDVRTFSYTTPPFTCRGVSPFFEIYGVDVMLALPPDATAQMAASSRPQEPGRRCQDPVSPPPALCPVVLEVNIMPSLSTHYSPLDQSIKSNFIADTLTLVGITSTAVKPPREQQVPAHTGNSFLDGITSVAGLEACLTAEEERQRASRFSLLFPPVRGSRRARGEMISEVHSESHSPPDLFSEHGALDATNALSAADLALLKMTRENAESEVRNRLPAREAGPRHEDDGPHSHDDAPLELLLAVWLSTQKQELD